jgi:DNA repair exonuclease SbcCD ATPase subunit
LNIIAEAPGAFRELKGVEHLSKIVLVDQNPIGSTPASNPATYTGMFDEIRELFCRMPEAKVRGYRPGRFSFNRAGGRCEDCEGMGQQKIEMHNSFINEINTNTEKRINESGIKIAKAQQEAALYNDTIKKLQQQVDQLQANAVDISTLRAKRKKLEQFDYRLQYKIKKISEEMQFYNDNDNCPTCKQNIDVNFKNGIVQQKHKCLTDTNEGVIKLEQEYEKIDEQIERILVVQEKTSKLQNEISKHNAHINSLSLLITSIQEDIEKINNEEKDNTSKTLLLESLQQELNNSHNTKEQLLEEIRVNERILQENKKKEKYVV